MMDRETEMYHAAIRILSNRAEQYEDELAHSSFHYNNNIDWNCVDKYGNKISLDDVHDWIDSELDNKLTSETKGILSEIDFRDKFYKKASKSELQQNVAARRLWSDISDDITKRLAADLKRRGATWGRNSDYSTLDTIVDTRIADYVGNVSLRNS